MRKPKPTVTDETPNGAMAKASARDCPMRARLVLAGRESAKANGTPTAKATSVAYAAARNELPSASITVTPPVKPEPEVASCR